jgi:hypothetical protein
MDPSAKPLTIVSVFLFGKPAWEIEGLEGSPIDLQLLAAVAECGEELNRRLTRAAEIGRKLVGGGWEGFGLLYDMEFYKEVRLKEAEDEMRGLAIEPDEVAMREELDEDEES